MKKQLLTAIVILTLLTGIFAQPTWTVNINAYQHSMTITGVINIEGLESTDPNDIIGVFINSECRGVSSPTYVSSLDRYLLFLMAYSNVAQGDTLSFKLYDASEDTILNIAEEIIFVAEDIEGIPDNPYIFDYHILNTEAEIINFSFVEQVAFASIDNIQHIIEIEINDTSDITSLTATFELSNRATAWINNTLQESNLTINNFSDTLIYTVISEDTLIEQVWQVIVNQYFLNAEADIIEFSFNEQVSSATINPVTNNIYIEIEANVNITLLVADFILSENALAYVDDNIQESNLSVNDYTSPVVYKIVSEDELTEKFWTVIVAQSTSEIKNYEEFNIFSIYPNPAIDKLHFTSCKLQLRIEEVEVFDVSGKMVKSLTVFQNLSDLTIDLSDLESGVYFVKVGNSVSRLIKE